MEGVLAAFAQFDNDCRSDRTRAGMKAALELGRWVFLAPIGYLNAPRAMGKSLMPDPERAPLVRRAFEEYATGRFTKQQLLKQVKSLGLDQPARPAAHIAGDRRAAAQPALCRHRGRSRVRRSRKARRLRAADLRGPVLPRAGGPVRATFRAPRRSSGRTRTSRCAPSCAASPVVEASPAAGRRAAASTTRTTTAALAVARST